MDTPDAIGRYPVERTLGTGAFASVWLARDDRLDSYVAIKVLAENWAAETDVRERFVKEARLLRQADSPHIVQVHDIGELPDGRPYFVMTYADMGTLSGRLLEGPMPVKRALELLGEVAEGVGELHRLGVVHRDLKPSNVLMRSMTGGGERAMVADLGVARALADATVHTIAAGTPGYMAPEQMRLDGAPDERADVHGLGALAYHMLTGEVPGSGAVRLAPRRLRGEVPERVSAAIMKAIDPEPERRWQSVAEFGRVLREEALGSGPGGEPASGELQAPGEPQDSGGQQASGGLQDSGELQAPGKVRDSGELQGEPPAAGGSKWRLVPVWVLATLGGILVAGVAGAVLLLRAGAPPDVPTMGPSASPTVTGGNDLRPDAPVPRQYRDLIVQAGTWCDNIPGLSPALIAAMLKVESDFDPNLNDPGKDEYGIARWTPRVLHYWQPGGRSKPEPKPPFSPELSIPSMGRFFCTLGHQISSLPGDPAANLVGLYRTSVNAMLRDQGIPRPVRPHVEAVMKYRDEYRIR
ncbi:serine/threonine-protein kinase [Nonomuraea typhae]|uniref:serine/threonine-protein kinase n=1 Tax=Nonomuraea typhae TaxID=2603600 RepID=UPI0012F7BF35|nr:serine/threonine-protein kinase [Nonomuraea typhae]